MEEFKLFNSFGCRLAIKTFCSRHPLHKGLIKCITVEKQVCGSALRHPVLQKFNITISAIVLFSSEPCPIVSEGI